VNRELGRAGALARQDKHIKGYTEMIVKFETEKITREFKNENELKEFLKIIARITGKTPKYEVKKKLRRNNNEHKK